MRSLLKIIAMTLSVIILLAGCSTSSQSSANEDKKVIFNQQSRQRLNEIKNSFPELDNIECYNGDCTSVVYFNLNKIPDDLEFVIRGNTATFSNFKLKNIGTSHVTIFATHNGNTILQCDGSKGKVDECK